MHLRTSFSAYDSPLFQRGARGDLQWDEAARVHKIPLNPPLKKGEGAVCAAMGGSRGFRRL